MELVGKGLQAAAEKINQVADNFDQSIRDFDEATWEANAKKVLVRAYQRGTSYIPWSSAELEEASSSGPARCIPLVSAKGFQH